MKFTNLSEKQFISLLMIESINLSDKQFVIDQINNNIVNEISKCSNALQYNIYAF